MISVVDWGANQQTKHPQAVEWGLAHQMISQVGLTNHHRQITTIILHLIMREKTGKELLGPILAVVGVRDLRCLVSVLTMTFLIIACMAITM